MVTDLYQTRKIIPSSFATVPDARWFPFLFWTNYLLLLINHPNLFCFGFTTGLHNHDLCPKAENKLAFGKPMAEKVVLSPELSNLKTDDLTAIDTFISDYNQEIDKYFGGESKLPKISPKK